MQFGRRSAADADEHGRGGDRNAAIERDGGGHRDSNAHGDCAADVHPDFDAAADVNRDVAADGVHRGVHRSEPDHVMPVGWYEIATDERTMLVALAIVAAICAATYRLGP